MTHTPLPPTSTGSDDWRISLERAAVALPEFGCYVALSEDGEAVFSCPMLTDGSPERDDDGSGRLNWYVVTAPASAFVEAVNDRFGTRFTMDAFAGR